MANKHKQVTIKYRKLERGEGFPAASLESLIRSALAKVVDGHPIRNRYRNRILSSADDNYFINTYTDQAPDGTPLVFGDIIHFTKGHLQALFKIDEQQGSSAPVEQLEAPDQREYVHSQLFWMVKGDHAFILQNLSLRTEDVEAYLSWLLGSKTAVVPSHTKIILTSKFDSELVGDDLNNIREIVIGGVAEPITRSDDEESPGEEVPPGERTVNSRGLIEAGLNTVWSQAREVLKIVLETDAKVDAVMGAVPPDADLHVSVHIGYKTKKRAINRAALKQLESGLRNLPDGQLAVTTNNSTQGVDGNIRLNHKGSIVLLKKLRGAEEVTGSLLDPNDVLRLMVEAYGLFLRNGKISP